MYILNFLNTGSSVRVAIQWVGIGAVAVVFFMLVYPSGSFTVAGDNPSLQYLDSQLCQTCHAEIYQSYQKVAMGQSFYPPSFENVVEDYTSSNHFYHAASNRHYRMIQRKDKFYQKRYQLDSERKEKNVFEMEITHIMGSGRHARTYLNLSDRGVLRQLPVSWYAEEEKWGMSPGYDQVRHDDFRRRITHSCMFCHAAYPRVPEPSDRYGQRSLFPQKMPSSIDCQRCHGAGSHHVELASVGQAAVEEIREAILNPANLSPERQMEVCLQCHGKTNLGKLANRVRRVGRTVYSFRVRESLNRYMVHFNLIEPKNRKSSSRFQLDSTAHRLLQSVCFVKSQGKMTCTTCHNPHQTLRGSEGVRHFRQSCLKCHSDLAEAAHPGLENNDCINCHMPKRRAEDAVHVVMTDHLIQRHRPNRDLLAPLEEDHSARQGKVVLHKPESLPFSERDLYLGMAQVQSPANLEEGIARLKTAIKREGVKTPEPYVRLAAALVDMGGLDEAESNLRRALQMDPDMVIPRYRLAEVLQESGKLDKAAHHYRQVLRLDPGYGEANIGLGIIYKQQGQFDMAIRHFKQALQSNPLLASGSANLGTTYLQQGKVIKATERFHQALRIEPADPQVHLNLGIALSRSGRHSEAIKAFHQAIALESNFPRAYYSLGLAEAQQGRQKQAVEAFLQAIRLKADHAASHYNLGVAYSQQGDLEQAAKAFKAVVRLKPDDPEAYYNLALAYDQLGKGQEAVEAWSQSIRLAPQDAEAYLNLGVAYSRTGALAEAVDAFRQAINLRPNFAEAYSNLGLAYGQVGRLKEALEAFKRAVEIHPRDSLVHFNLGLAYLMLGQRDLAMEEYEILKDLEDHEKAHLLIRRINQQGPS